VKSIPATDNRAGDFWLAIGILTALTGAAVAWEAGDRTAGIDFHLVWIGADAVRHSVVQDVYRDQASPEMTERYLRRPAEDKTHIRRQSAAAGTETLGLSGTPLLYASIAPLSTADYDRDYRLYQFVSLVALFVAIWLFGRLAGFPAPAILVMFGVLAISFFPIVSDTHTGNVNRLQLAMLAIAAHFLARRRGDAWIALGGFVLCWAVLFKPNVIGAAGVLAFWWIAGRRFRRLAVAAVGAFVAVGVIVAITAGFFGTFRCWASWFDAVRQLHDWYRAPADNGNFGLMEVLREECGRSFALPLTIVFAGVVAAAAWISRLPEGSDAGNDSQMRDEATLVVALMGAGCAIWFESAWLVWLHYLVMLMPMLLVVLRPMDSAPRGLRLAMRGIGVATVLVLNQSVFRLVPHPTNPRWAILANFAIVALLAITLIEITRIARAARRSAGARA